MKKIIIGEKDFSKNYDFRETCFGIVVKNNKLYCTEKRNELSLIGGGIEQGESHLDCLKREFSEEAGLMIKSAEPLCVIDCFWLTKDKKNMESLANIYIVETLEEKVEPTEEGCKLKCIKLDNAINLFPLPYHKKALEEYFAYIKMKDNLDILKVKIRKVQKDDLRAVSEITVTGWQTAYRGIIDDIFLDNLDVEENYKKRLNDYTENGFVVAECDNEIVGFCRYRIGNYYKDIDDDIDCEICALYVKPEYKRKGIGRKLVNYVMNEFKGNGYFKMILWCLKDNYPSRAFYEKMGGKYCGENLIIKGNKEYKEVGYIYYLRETYQK